MIASAAKLSAIALLCLRTSSARSGLAKMSAASFVQSPAASSMPSASGNGMRKSGVALRKIGVLEPQIFGERIAEFLRGIHPTKTALCVEAETQISFKTIGKWLEGASSPSGNAYHRLIEVYGPELFVFVSPDASPASLREAARMSAQARAERQRDVLERKIAALWSAR